jgi:hypothetical protein
MMIKMMRRVVVHRPSSIVDRPASVVHRRLVRACRAEARRRVYCWCSLVPIGDVGRRAGASASLAEALRRRDGSAWGRAPRWSGLSNEALVSRSGASPKHCEGGTAAIGQGPTLEWTKQRGARNQDPEPRRSIAKAGRQRLGRARRWSGLSNEALVSRSGA